MPPIARLFVTVCLLCLPVMAQAQASVVEPTWNLRLRNEQVTDDAFTRDATADTLRLRAGLRFTFGSGWTALVEGEGLANAGDTYNSGANGQIGYPMVLDPEGFELNQAWIAWRSEPLAATLGRQRILLDNQRWVGNVGWRQNEQTFDALAFQWRPINALTVSYDWVDRVHRVAGDKALNPLAREHDLTTQFFNVAYKDAGQQWTGYAYLYGDDDLATASSASYGLRWTGNRVQDGNGWGWALEVAQQRDYADNPLQFSHHYWLIEPSVTCHGTTFKAGWEYLGGNGSHALQTPLATLHAFNGWADKFLATPVNGLEDRYLSVAGQFGHIRGGRFAWVVAWHDFSATDTADDYGREWDASLGFPLAKGLQGLVKLADYQAGGYARDTTKIWLQLEWSDAR